MKGMLNFPFTTYGVVLCGLATGGGGFSAFSNPRQPSTPLGDDRLSETGSQSGRDQKTGHGNEGCESNDVDSSCWSESSISHLGKCSGGHT